jgi:predicted ester cyclase
VTSQYNAREAETMTTQDADAAVVRRFIDEVINNGKPDLAGDFWSQDLTWHGGSLGEVQGLEPYKQMLRAASTGAFSGMHLTIHDVVAAERKVAVRFTNSGTHTGPFLGAPATGNHAEWLGIAIYTVTDGKITDAWFSEDILGMLLQLGVVQLPATSA